MIHYVTLYATQPNIISKQQGDTLKQKSLITKHGDIIIDSIKKIKIWRNNYYSVVLVVWDNFCKLVERINVSAIDPIATSNIKLTTIRIEKAWASML
jgi:hypothetical protein